MGRVWRRESARRAQGMCGAPKNWAVCEKGSGVELLTAAQMRAIEQAAIESGAVTGLELMERAGRGVVEAIFEEWPELRATSHRAVVLCGPGNNGGDGFVVARVLKEWGWEVEVLLYGDAEKLPPDARVNYDRWRGMGEVYPMPANMPYTVWSKTSASLVVDAIFGTGACRELPTIVEEAVATVPVANIQGDKVRCVAVDVPSGLSSDNGDHLSGDPTWPGTFMADLTVSFHTEKTGHRLSSAPRYCGRIVTVDIGLEGSPRPRVGVKPPPLGAVGGCPAVPPGKTVNLIDESIVQRVKKSNDTHKYTHGHALILSGSMGRSGAARLAARGALRVGAGVVTVAAPGSAMMECATQLTAVMLRKCDDADGLAALLEDDRINALCLGPGLGLDRARALVETLGSSGIDPRPTVLDADALTAFADNSEALFAHLHPQCVLTPHAGEFAWLFPDIAEKLEAPATKGPAYSKVDATREAAKRAGCTVLFKGPDTVIADEKGHAAINSAAYDRAAPWLATAGSGDVLAGIITGLLARGFGAMQAAETGAWLHVEAALEFGPGLIAEDLPEALPAVFRRLLQPDRR